MTGILATGLLLKSADDTILDVIGWISNPNRAGQMDFNEWAGRSESLF